MSSYHEVIIYNQDGVQQAILQGWEYLMYCQQLNAPHYHEIHLKLAYNDPRIELLRHELESDWIFEFYRLTDGQMVKVYEGFHRTVYEQTTTDGYIIFNLYGRGFLDLLNRRICVPDAGEEYVRFAGAGETVIKQFVNHECVSNSNPARNFVGLSIEPDAGRGGYAEYSARYTNLMTVISSVAKQAELDFGIVGKGAVGQFELQVRPLWGQDKRHPSINNNPPVIFDILLNNMDIPVYARNSSDERNVFYVGGQGQGTNRTVVVLEDTKNAARSYWNRVESFVDARSEENEEGLLTIASEQQEKYKYRPSLSFKVFETAGTRWIRDWQLGDIVTARYYGLDFLKKVKRVTVTVSAGETGQIEFITADMDDVDKVWLLEINNYTELEEATWLG